MICVADRATKIPTGYSRRKTRCSGSTSYEQSLDSTESIVKLTVNLGRQFSVVGRAGTESAIDFMWNHSFGK